MSAILLFTLFTGLAFVLFVAEVFLPGGIIGIIGGISLLAACGFAFSAFGPSTGALVSLLLIVSTLGGFFYWLMKMPDTRIGKTFSLQTSLKDADAETPSPLIGKQGVAVTDLRPSGYARIDDNRIDVVAKRGYIKKGEAIQVLEVRGVRVVVEAVTKVSA